MASRRTNPQKPTKDVAQPNPANKPRSTKAVVKDLRTGVKDLQAIDPEHPWAKLLKEAIAAIRDVHSAHVNDVLVEAVRAGCAKVAHNSEVGLSQVWGELEQVKVHLARFIDQGIRERNRDERIEEQLAAINERLKSRTRDERFVYHGRVFTVSNFAKEIDSIVGKVEKAAAERCEQAEAIAARKGEELDELHGELARLRSELNLAGAAQALAAAGIHPPGQPFIRQFDMVP